MEEDGRWITTKYGARVFIKNQNKTNKYMNEKIRNNSIKVKTKEQTYELYHGSKDVFDNFDDQYIGKRSLGGLTYGKGHYFLGEKQDTYGQEGYKVKVTLQNPFIIQERKWSTELQNMGYDWWDFNRPDPSDFLASKGYDGTIIMNEDRLAEAIIYTNNDGKIKIIDKFKNY